MVFWWKLLNFSPLAPSSLAYLPLSWAGGALKSNSFVKACVWHDLRQQNWEARLSFGSGGCWRTTENRFFSQRSPCKLLKFSPLAPSAIASACLLFLFLLPHPTSRFWYFWVKNRPFCPWPRASGSLLTNLIFSAFVGGKTSYPVRIITGEKIA